MAKWEYTFYESTLIQNDATRLWKHKHKDGTTDYDLINEMGEQGWELVNVTPIGIHFPSDYLLFTFKRPKPNVDQRERGIGLESKAISKDEVSEIPEG